MKRFIIRILIFLFPVVLLLGAWEVLMHNFPHVLNYKRTVITEQCRANGEALFLGSSHSYFGINTDTIPNAYNLGFVSQNLNQDRLIFEHFLSKPNKLKYVLIPVSLFSFFTSKADEEKWRTVNYVRYWHFPAQNVTDYFFVLDKIPLQLKYVQKTARKIRKKGLNKVLSCSPTGWGEDYAEARDFSLFKKLGKKGAARHGNVNLNDIKYFYALKDIIQLAEKNNIKVILFTPPAHQSYYTNISQLQENKMRKLLSEITDRKRVFYLDLLRSDNFVDQDFFDPDHMSHRGAKKLASTLYTFYKNINGNIPAK